MKLYLIRHGETNWNREEKLQGRTDIPLNEDGRLVAELTRESLKDVKFNAAFTSPLMRAKETAEIILKGRNIPIFQDERIIEIGFGANEGMKRNNWDDNMRNFFFHTDLYVPAEGGETLEAVLEREREFLERLFADKIYQNSTILISTHGAALSGLLTIIKNNPIAKLWAGGLHKNCGISIIEVKAGVPKILEEAIVLYDEKQLEK